MNSAAFGGWWWKRTHEDRRGKFSLRSRCLDSSKSLHSSSLCHLFQIESGGMLEMESGGMTLLDTLQSSLRVFRASPECFRSQPPKAAEFISPARQGWEQRVADGKPRRGDIKILAPRKNSADPSLPRGFRIRIRKRKFQQSRRVQVDALPAHSQMQMRAGRSSRGAA
jgi:hypothetical protein